MRRFLLVLLLCPFLMGAWARVGTILTGNEKVNDTSLDITTTAALEQNNVGVCVFASDNFNKGTGDHNDHPTVTDTQGNSWIKAVEHANAGNSNQACIVSVWYTKATTTLASGDTITFNISAAKSAKAATCDEFTIVSTSVLSVDGTQIDQTDGGDPPNMTLSGLESREHLFVRGVCGETDDTGWTSDASYTAFTHTSSTTSGGGAAGNIGARGGSRVLNATNDNNNPTWVSMDNASGLIALDEDAAAPTRSRVVDVE